ncbi:glycosyltransferase [Roseicyclus sp. F158]|uniref:Glycosyltransferase n=1 Tax=Tropicimonas omnivorans TaxID=3075590 RepID=A0ABU3DLD1_9RHOB|nr:glycosyltransferase [Roseicyclus sp. F158]MDT0684534.1 glycosyltransferase [Roseicyclus sp. F158]
MTRQFAPVVLFAYARPDHLRQTLTALAKAEGARKTTLWVFSDGARNAEAEANVARVRALLKEQNWRSAFQSVTVVEAKHNKGLAKSIIGGVTQVIAEEGRVIVLEDDLLVAPEFLTFMNTALDFHAQNAAVGSVTGYCPLPQPPKGYEHDVYAVPRSCSHSWATWRERWETVDWSGKGAPRLWREKALRKRFMATGSDKLDRLRRQLERRIDSWSIMFNLWHVINDRVAIYPVRNLVRNIGFDGSGTHTRAHDRMHTALSGSGTALTLNLPPEDPRVLAAFHKAYSGSLPGRLRRTVRNWRMPAVFSSLDPLDKD